jgi:hypothetical protein
MDGREKPIKTTTKRFLSQGKPEITTNLVTISFSNLEKW